jgi:NADH-quinone oxidoreductase subunit L
MTVPLLVLAIFSLVGGGLGIASIYALRLGHGADAHSTLALVTSLLAVTAGLALAWNCYRRAASDPLPGLLRGFATAAANRFYIDEWYERTFIRLHDALAGLADGFDRWIIAGLAVRGLSIGTELTGRLLRLAQTGNVQTYAFLFTLGLALLLYFMIGW